MAIITISRGTMSGGEALATCLAERLGYPVVGREILVAAAERLGVGEDALAQKIVKGPGLWERLTSNRKFYVVAVQAALAEHAVSGDLVYHGHAGHLLLREIPNVFRVRLTAPLEMRVKSVMERQQLSRQGALAYIENVDEDRIRWTKFIYGVDWRDPALYDVVVNLEKMTIPTACRMIIEAISAPEYAISDAVKQTLADFRLVCRVKLALASNPQTRDMEFELGASAGVVEVRGELPGTHLLSRVSDRDDSEILRTVQAVKGVKSVELRLRKLDAAY